MSLNPSLLQLVYRNSVREFEVHRTELSEEVSALRDSELAKGLVLGVAETCHGGASACRNRIPDAEATWRDHF